MEEAIVGEDRVIVVTGSSSGLGAAMIKEGHYGVMGTCAAAICIPPLGLGLATLLNRKLWSDDEKEAGIAAVAKVTIDLEAVIDIRSPGADVETTVFEIESAIDGTGGLENASVMVIAGEPHVRRQFGLRGAGQHQDG